MNMTKGIFIVQISLMGLIAFWAVRAAIAFFVPQSVWMPVDARPALDISGPFAPSAAAAGLDVNFDPFHRRATSTPLPAALGAGAPETKLDLKLVGRRSGEGGTAILLAPDGTQKIYRIGEEILPRVTLKAVDVDFVVISQDGRLERLTFSKQRDNELRAPASNALATGAPTSAGFSDDTVTVHSSAGQNIQRNGKANYKASRSRLNANRDGLAAIGNQSAQFDQDTVANPAAPQSLPARTSSQAASRAEGSLLSALRFTPNRVDGAIIGYEVTPRQAGFDVSAVGLRNGDILTQIDGWSLQGNNVNLPQIMNNLQGRQSTRVNLIRDGEALSLSLGAP